MQIGYKTRIVCLYTWVTQQAFFNCFSYLVCNKIPKTVYIVWHFSNNQMPFPWWFVGLMWGGCKLAYLTECESCCVKVDESLWCCYSRICVGGDSDGSSCSSVLLLKISSEDVSIGSCYISKSTSELILFPKEYGGQSREIKLRSVCIEIDLVCT